MQQIYLDYNATTPIDPAVAEAMIPFLRTHFGNPSSAYRLGKFAQEAVETARAQLAHLIGAEPDEIVFTGGGSEASNQAIKGTIFAKVKGIFGRFVKGAHIITSAVEHPATMEPCQFLKKLGCKLTILPVDEYGMVKLDDFRQVITRSTNLVSIMHSNNEVGTLQPIREIAEIAHRYGAVVHTDVSQSLGKVPVHVNDLDVDYMTIAGHKLYAPKGIGALYVRKGLKPEPLVHGAGHESGRRAGTENVPYIVGLGKAAEIAMESFPEVTAKLQDLRDRLWSHLREVCGREIVLHGHPENRLPNTLNVSFLGYINSELLEALPQIAASTGSACHEGKVTISPVLKAMGVSKQVAKGAIRLSVGRFTTLAQIDQTAELFHKAIRG
ncbi:MAG: cysteine desulfurase family protein [Gemmataceae bacterium]